VLKNTLGATTTEEEKRNELFKGWLDIDPNARAQIKQVVMSGFASNNSEARRAAAQSITQIGLIELPLGQWPDLIALLLNNMTQRAPDQIREATLETLGFICEAINPEVLGAQSNHILTAIVHGMNSDEQNPKVRLAAIVALNNCLDFIRSNFAEPNERNFIMQVVCESSQVADKMCRVKAFECLVAIAMLYYEFLASYMQVLFEITLKAIKEDTEEAALQAVEFWSTVADVEIEILTRNEDLQSRGLAPSAACQNFASGAVRFIAPVLMAALTKQEDDEDDEDAWNLAMASGTCLSLFAAAVQDEIVPIVLPFVSENINHSDWHFREAATLAFGSILSGPHDALIPVLQQSLSTLLAHMQDPSEQVRDTNAWTIGRIIQLHPMVVGEDVNFLVQKLLECLGDVPRVARHICWAIHNVAEVFKEQGDLDTSGLSVLFQPVLTALLNVISRSDADEFKLRISGYEAINELIQAAPADCHQIVLSVQPLFMRELQSTLATQPLSVEERAAHEEKQGLLCSVLQMIALKLPESVPPIANDMMMLLLAVFHQNRASGVHEEALMGVGAVANAIGADFLRYMNDFAPFLYQGLQNYQASAVCQIAVGIVGDICRALEGKILPYCDEIITHLLNDLRHKTLDKAVKPPILACFGDIALAIEGKNYLRYLNVVMTMLQHACNANVDTSDDEMVAYLNQLRESIFTAWTGILHGLDATGDVQYFMQYINHILTFITFVYNEEQGAFRNSAVTKSLLSLIGDIAQICVDAKGLINQDYIRAIVDREINSPFVEVREAAEWAQTSMRS
jgi:importin subunit beta-1